MNDFTFEAYKKLIFRLKEKNYNLVSFLKSLRINLDRYIILRHDIDKKPQNALKIAQLLYNLNIQCSFYFRINKNSYDIDIMKEIASLGHEIGYHYEDLTLAKGNKKLAIEYFEDHLSKLRNHIPIETICMHGSPLSKWDNRDIWNYYNYKDFGIVGEPYFDIDFNEVLYLTDTGRTWNGEFFSVRDKVKTSYNLKFRSTWDVIKKIDSLPDKVMINFHPQRWNDNSALWMKELVFQNIKNVIKKRFFVKK